MRFIDNVSITFKNIYDNITTYLSNIYNQNKILFTEASPYGQIVKVLSALQEQMFYYLDTAMAENNPLTASNAESIYGNAVLAGHNPTRNICAKGMVKLSVRDFSFFGDYINLPTYIKIKCLNNNLIYTIVLNKNIQNFLYKDKFIIAPIYQGEFKTTQFVATGSDLQTISISNEFNIDNDIIYVYCNGLQVKPVISLYDMAPGAYNCVIKTGLSGGVDILFGNSYFGFVPPQGAEITIEYLITDGANGNIYTNATDIKYNILDKDGSLMNGDIVDLNQYISIEFIDIPNFGSNKETVEFTKYISPYISKSFALINEQHFETFFKRYTDIKLLNVYNTIGDENIQDDNIIYLDIIYDLKRRKLSSQNYFTIPLKNFVLSETDKNKLKKILKESGLIPLTMDIVINDIVIKKYIANIYVRYYDTYNVNIIYNNIINKISDFLLNYDYTQMRINRSDMIRILEDIEGIDSVNVTFLSEDMENALLKNIPTSNNLGLDEFGDIRVNKGELPVLRGGFYDRNGNYIPDMINNNGIGSINVFFIEKIKK